MRVIAGEFIDSRGPAKTITPINIWDLDLNAGSSLDARVPAGHTTVLIVQHGNLIVNDESTKSLELVFFERQRESVNVRADTASRVLVLTGDPLNEPVYGQGPFVMNSREEIHDAILDYQAGKMGTLT